MPLELGGAVLGAAVLEPGVGDVAAAGAALGPGAAGLAVVSGGKPRPKPAIPLEIKPGSNERCV